jgi:lactaldehyde reductase
VILQNKQKKQVTVSCICHLFFFCAVVHFSLEVILLFRKDVYTMANRFVLNETSYHGKGAIAEIAHEVTGRGFQKAFVCSDPDLLKFGVTQKVIDVLENAGIAYEIYSNIKANPTIENVQTGVAAFQASGAQCLIAIGGGSSMDTAKAIGIISANPEFADVRSLEGVADTKNPSVPIIAVPTTAGTAAEVTINYVITDTEKNRKMVCVDPHDIPVVAVVDPDMMSTMPKGLTAATGMDALTHAIEGYITLGAWELSDMFHLKAIEIISRSLRGAVENTPEGREGMALGQYVAGMGFSNVGLGIVHSMAHPLGALYDTPHGVANAIILPTVMEYNAPATGEKYREIARAMGVKGVDEMTQEEYRKAAVDAVRQLSKDVGIPADLKDIVKEEDIAFLSQSAYDDACRPGNPRETSVEEIAALYRSLL